ncbi:MAG: long-chain fatty acid--CoA ligase, partial [Microbacteriaceae bacterium]|nr:long-chain fatty acid--CoA ligase [Microbacteriaceae bacterium]
AMPMRRDDVVLGILPQYHVAAWNVQPLLAWWHGATVVLERSFQPDRVLQLVQESGVTTLMGVPTQYRVLHDVADGDRYDLSSLRTAVVGGATMPSALAAAWAERGVHLTQGYGLTEAAPNVLHLRHEDLAAHPGAVGRPYPGVETSIVDPESLLALDGAATGELWVRGPSSFAGYLDDPEATERAMHDGWLRTGDLVHRDAHGVHRVVDRLKNIFVSGGENVAPAEVELALAAHPVVAEVCVVSVPDPVWGERGFAFVVTNGPLSADELVAFARGRLAAFKIPAHVEFVSELPRTTIEKVARHRLRKRAAWHLSEKAGQTHV